MDDDDEQDLPEFYDADRSQGVRLNWVDPLIAGLTFAMGIAEAFSSGFSTMRGALVMHGLSIAEKQDFAKRAGREIEALTDGR